MLGKKKKNTSGFPGYRKQASIWQWVFAGVILVLFAVVIGYVYMQRDALEAETLNPPLIMPQNTPIKSRAVDPGGIDIPDQDKQVFDLLERVDRKEFNKAPEQVAPQPTIIQDIITPPKEEPLIVVPEESVSLKKPIYAPKEGGDWGVQLASFTTLEDGRNALAKFHTDYYDIIGKLKSDMQRASVKGKVYYRTRFMGLANREEATEVCRLLKVRNQGCLAVKK